MSPERLWIDLQRAPLMRIEVAPEGRSGRWYVLLQYHHLMTDHISIEILVSEVMAHFGGSR